MARRFEQLVPLVWVPLVVWQRELGIRRTRPDVAPSCEHQRFAREPDRLYRWPLGRRPDDHPSLSDLGLYQARKGAFRLIKKRAVQSHRFAIGFPLLLRVLANGTSRARAAERILNIASAGWGTVRDGRHARIPRTTLTPALDRWWRTHAFSADQ
ncbi:MAG: COGs COG3558 [uncultured Paraburkholderia sp.]|nr:MAG: COGs COG3558 [uncultured Paraburkholderia sp.]CAH2942679.1 MAG: COGs COG3558 [uncultured Paraburkholderia sp.]